jgi:hypothetical protein
MNGTVWSRQASSSPTIVELRLRTYHAWQPHWCPSWTRLHTGQHCSSGAREPYLALSGPHGLNATAPHM